MSTTPSEHPTDDELRRVADRVAQVVYEALRPAADAGTVVPTPRGAPQSGHVLTLDSAWLVAEEGFDGFQPGPEGLVGKLESCPVEQAGPDFPRRETHQ